MTVLATRTHKCVRAKIWGTPGIKLWFNEGADVIGWKENNAQNRELWLNFANCRFKRILHARMRACVRAHLHVRIRKHTCICGVRVGV